MHVDTKLDHRPSYSTDPRDPLGAQGAVTRRSLYRTVRLCALLALTAVVLALVSARAADARSDTNAPNAQYAQSADFQTIDTYVISQMQAMHIPGVALGIVKGDQTVHVMGFGVSDPAGERVTPQTSFILGSTSKSFTALAIMQLVEAGKISLDAPVQRYLPWFQVGTRSAPTDPTDPTDPTGHSVPASSVSSRGSDLIGAENNDFRSCHW